MNNQDLPGDDADLLESLRTLQGICSTCSKHEQAIVLIHACIDAGCNTKEGIFGMLRLLDWNMRHAGIILSNSTGNNPGLHHWRRDEAGIYLSHP